MPKTVKALTIKVGDTKIIERVDPTDEAAMKAVMSKFVGIAGGLMAVTPDAPLEFLFAGNPLKSLTAFTLRVIKEGTGVKPTDKEVDEISEELKAAGITVEILEKHDPVTDALEDDDEPDPETTDTEKLKDGNRAGETTEGSVVPQVTPRDPDVAPEQFQLPEGSSEAACDSAEETAAPSNPQTDKVQDTVSAPDVARTMPKIFSSPVVGETGTYAEDNVKKMQDEYRARLAARRR